MRDQAKTGMADMQSMRDPRNIPIDKVGVKGIRYPIVVLDRSQGTQQTVASINMFVNLPKEIGRAHV